MTAKKILLVDDDRDLLEILEIIFKDEGYDVVSCETAEEVQTIAESFLPDLILLDLNLKKETGFDVAKKLKNWKETADIPIVFMSACDSKDALETAFMIGAIDYITKPVSVKEIIQRTKPVIELGKLQKLVSRFSRVT